MAGRFNRAPAEEKPIDWPALLNEALTAEGKLSSDRENLSKVVSFDITSSRLTFVAPTSEKDTAGRRKSLYHCSCGSQVLAAPCLVRNGNTKSCGCLKIDRSRMMAAIHREASHRGLAKRMTTHGQTGTRFYGVWAAMLRRCENANDRSFSQYGGRGIKVCQRWHKFENFYADMYESYQDHREKNSTTTIERDNVNGDYSPENCSWATRKQQARNTTRTVRLTHDGVTKTLTDWADDIGLSRGTLEMRLYDGWTVSEALTIPLGGRRRSTN